MARADPKHVRERELPRGTASGVRLPSELVTRVLVRHSRLPSGPHNCLQDLYFGPYRNIKINGSGIHVRLSPCSGGELLCAPKQLRHYHSADHLGWDEWRLSDIEVERIDLENGASHEGADELEEMTADEMALDCYYAVVGIARHEYK